MTLKDLQREGVCFDILNALADEDMVLIGGYAVSAYGRPRFSVDLDLVIASPSLGRIRNLLKEKGFTKVKGWDGGGVFAGMSERWKLPGPELPTSVDLLVDGLHDRGTGASFSFRELKVQASRRDLFGLSGSSRATALVADPEVLVALKLVAGRKTDLRDIAALAVLDLRVEIVAGFLKGVPKEVVRQRVVDFRSALRTVEFQNSLQGVFMMDKSRYPQIAERAKNLCLRLEDLLSAG